MRIGVITFHRSLNYGSVLQTYALQKTIKKLRPEADVEVIDYYPSNYKRIRGLFVPVKSFRNLLRNIYSLRYYLLFIKRKKAFDNFIKDNVTVGSKRYIGNDDMSDLNKWYDLLIAGSDQIWNRNTADFSIKYFFPENTNIKKIAYAPSLGDGRFNIKGDGRFYNVLSSFSAISTREVSGAKNLKKFLSRDDISVVIDPTLLLRPEDYCDITNDGRFNYKYIFIYSLTSCKGFQDLAIRASSKLNLPIITVFSSIMTVKYSGKDVKISKYSAPGDFLSLIKNAEFVITNSFHGTAFSIEFEKKFFSVVSEDPAQRDSRITTLLNRIGLANRMITSNSQLDNLSEEIDYAAVKEKLEVYRAESIKFLQDNLNLDK